MSEQDPNPSGEDTSKLNEGGKSEDADLESLFKDEEAPEGETLEDKVARLEAQDEADAESLYSTLENSLVPMYYDQDDHGVPHDWIEAMKESIATCAPAFSTRRMLKQYANELYAPLAVK